MQKTALSVAVGWGSRTDTSVNLNFRLKFEGLEWVETIEYTFLCILSEAVESSQVIRDAYFPTIDDQLLLEMSLSKSLQKKTISPNFVQNMEVIRKSLEVWIVAIFDHLVALDDESKQWCKQLFFKSHEKLLVYEKLCGMTVESSPKSASIPSTPATPPRSSEVVRSVPKNDPSHKDYNKSIFTKVSHKIQKMGKHKQNVDANSSGISSSSNHKRVETDDDDEPKLTVTDRESVFSYSQSDRPPVTNQNGSKQHKPISISGMFRSHKNKDSPAPSDVEESSPASVKIEVQRGEEYKPGVIVYDIIIKVFSKKHSNPVVFSTFQRYNSFKLLSESLATISSSGSASGKEFIALLTQPFPKVTTSVAFFGLSDTALSERTRSLDAWFREVCVHYRSMPAQAKAAVREFLNFDMSKPKDIFVQDQLTWGDVEPHPSAGAGSAGGSVVLVVPRSVAENRSGSIKDKASVSAASAAAGGGAVASSGSVKSGAAPSVFRGGRQSFYAASDAGIAVGGKGGGHRMSLMSPSDASIVWETQSHAADRR